MPTFLDANQLNQPVWIFERRIKFTYKLQLQRLMDWESIPAPTKTDPFILQTTNVDIRMLHGYRALAPIWVHNRRIAIPFDSIQNADKNLPVEKYILRLSTCFQCLGEILRSQRRHNIKFT